MTYPPRDSNKTYILILFKIRAIIL